MKRMNWLRTTEGLKCTTFTITKMNLRQITKKVSRNVTQNNRKTEEICQKFIILQYKLYNHGGWLLYLTYNSHLLWFFYSHPHPAERLTDPDYFRL